MSILLVEDNLMNQRVAQRLLEKWGHRVTIAENGVCALEALDLESGGDSSFDLILMDIQMPVMDGVTATKEIRSLEARLPCKPTPIIAVTANTDKEDRDRCLAAGMDDYTTKPIKVGPLFSLVESIAANSSDKAA